MRILLSYPCRLAHEANFLLAEVADHPMFMRVRFFTAVVWGQRNPSLRSQMRAGTVGLRLASHIPARLAAATSTQRQAMGLSRGTLHWLRKPDHQRISLTILADLARGLGVGLDDLLEAPQRP